MAGKTINSSASGFLVVLLPMAFAIAFLFVAWPVLLALVLVGICLRLWQNYQWQKWSQQVNPFFHQLIQETQGRVTALDLAMKANLSGAAAQRYLDTKAQEFGARALDYQDKGKVYYFITANTLGSIFDDSEPSSESYFNDAPEALAPSRKEPQPQESADEELEEPEEPTDEQRDSKALIQSELARRLDVHSSTIHKRRSEPYFADWSQGRDPEGISWRFEPDSMLFFPIETES
ncbi:hypothetical protein [Coleofasciculus sp. H7-2]|uniref:hypothetical protein n=1 Tax=Coleofasciculus sp. H7-2 TaxID=3351545 RepID=UPI00366C2939